MQQQTILNLLEEAAELATDMPRNWRRVNEIQCLLNHAAFQDDEGQDPLLSRAAALQTVIDHLYVEAIRNAPQRLPTLFPAFALLCGDMEHSIIAHIDWSILTSKE